MQFITIEGKLWKPETWSVFCQAVRTNNDVEGWQWDAEPTCKAWEPKFLFDGATSP